jgi:anti-anti-sigma factor
MTVHHSPECLASVHVVQIRGALRAPMSGELRHCVQALLGRGERRIVLNLAGVSELDAAGLGELVRAHNIAVSAGGVLRIANAGGRIRTILGRVGLLALLDADPDRVLGEGLPCPARPPRFLHAQPGR